MTNNLSLKDKIKKITDLSRELVDISYELGYVKSEKINKEITNRIEKDIEDYSLDDLNKISLMKLVNSCFCSPIDICNTSPPAG